MSEVFNQAVRGKLAARKPGIAKKAKPADPEELLARAQAALEELQTVLAELAAAEPTEPTEEGGRPSARGDR